MAPSPNLAGLLAELLAAGESRATEPFERVLADELLRRHAVGTAAQAQQVVSAVASTLDRIAENHRQIREGRAMGVDRTAWFAGRLGQLADRTGRTEPTDPLSAKASAAEVMADVAQLALDAGALEGVFKAVPELEMAAAGRFLAAEFDDPAVRPFVEACAAAVTIDAQDASSPFHRFKEATPEQVAAVADLGAQVAKAAYDVGSGKATVIDAIERLVDRVAAAVIAVAEPLCMEGGARVGELVAAAMATVFAPGSIEVARRVGTVVGHAGGKAITPAVREGVRLLAGAAKQMVRASANLVEKVRQSIVSYFA